MTMTGPESEHRSDLLTAGEVSTYLRVPLQTVYRLHRDGRLRGMPITAKNYRWRRSDVDAYLTRLAGRTTAT